MWKTMAVSVSLVIAFGLTFLAPGAASPQSVDCGNVCDDCGIFGSEGKAFDPNGQYDMRCEDHTSICNACPLSLKSTDMTAFEISEAFRSASDKKLTYLMSLYGERALLDRDRRILVIQGSGCSRTALSALVPLSPEAVAALEAVGTPSLKSFLSTESQLAVDFP